MKVRGPQFLVLALVFVIAAATGLFFIFRHAISHRFAVGVYSVRETPDVRPPHKLWFIDLNRDRSLLRDRSIVVWIERGTAGKTGLTGLAYLLSDTGEPLAPPQVLAVKKNQVGRTVEETIFAVAPKLKEGKTVGVLVMRLPLLTEAMKQFFLEETKGARTQLERIAKMKYLCAQFNGYSEFVVLYLSSENKS